MDAPLRAHWPKLSLWVVEEGTLLALTITMWLDPEETVWDPTITDCRQQNWNCHFTRKPCPPALLPLACCFCLACKVSRASVPPPREVFAHLAAAV